MKFIFTTILIFCCSILFAQNTILWKVSNQKNNKVSYLLGTYHLMGNSFVDSFPVIKEKLLSSAVLITETELDREKMTAYYNSGTASDKLSKTLPEKDVNYIKDILKKSKIDIFKLTPGVLFVTLNSNYPKFKCGNPQDTTVFDMYLQQIAKTENKKLLYLETDSFGLNIIKEMTKNFTWNNFKQFTPLLLEKYRKESLDETDCDFMKKYETFDLDYSFNKKCVADAAKVESRNENWMKQIPTAIENNNCLIAVGLLHLYNKCGIIEELKKLGYTVEPVDMR